MRVILLLEILVLAIVFSSSLLLGTLLIKIKGKEQYNEEVFEGIVKSFESSPEKEWENRLLSYKKMAQTINSNEDQVDVVQSVSRATELLPDGVYLYNINYNKEGAKLSLSGFSSSRDKLLIFRERLRSVFEGVSFPSSTWVDREELEFVVQLEI